MAWLGGWNVFAASPPSRSPPAPRCSSSAIGTLTRRTCPSRRCSPPRRCTTTWCVSRRAPAWAWWSRPVRHARSCTLPCSSATAPKPSTRTWRSRRSPTWSDAGCSHPRSTPRAPSRSTSTRCARGCARPSRAWVSPPSSRTAARRSSSAWASIVGSSTGTSRARRRASAASASTPSLPRPSRATSARSPTCGSRRPRSRSAASIAGGARASSTSGTPRSSASCSTPSRAATRTSSASTRRCATTSRACTGTCAGCSISARPRRRSRCTRSSRRPASSDVSPRLGCRTARSRRRCTRRWPSP